MSRRVPLLIAAVVVVAVGVWFYAWATGPATSTSTTTSASENVFGSQIQLVPYDSQYFSTQVPSTLVLKSSNENSAAPILGQYLFKHSSTALADQLGITVGVMQGALDEVPAVKLRLQQPDIYSQTAVPAAPAGAIAFSKQGTYETSVFWAVDGRYAGVAVSGSVLRQADLGEILNSVISNWQWQQ